jgi:hypothetical protein
MADQWMSGSHTHLGGPDQLRRLRDCHLINMGVVYNLSVTVGEIIHYIARPFNMPPPSVAHYLPRLRPLALRPRRGRAPRGGVGMKRAVLYLRVSTDRTTANHAAYLVAFPFTLDRLRPAQDASVSGRDSFSKASNSKDRLHPGN